MKHRTAYQKATAKIDPEKVRQACFDVTGTNVREIVAKQKGK